MYKREYYLETLRKVYFDNHNIKMLYGLRRCGKTTLLKQIIEELEDEGVEKEHILFLDFDSFFYEELKEATNLINYIKNIVKDNEIYYIFLDEVQKVKNFEEAIFFLHSSKQFNLFISSSGLSNTFLTKYKVNFISLEILPLSFLEIIDLKKASKKNYKNLLFQILEWGSMPEQFLNLDEAKRKNDLLDMVDAILLNMVISSLKVMDVFSLNKVMQYIIETEGKSFSATGILQYLERENCKVATDTLYKYLNALCDSFLLHKIERLDIQNNTKLKTLGKFYVTDLGIKKVKTNWKKEFSICFENLVYRELLFRGYTIFLGKNGKEYFSFVVKKEDKTKYIECCYSITTAEIMRIVNKFNRINDTSKYVISFDYYDLSAYSIQCVSIFDFLLDKNF